VARGAGVLACQRLGAAALARRYRRNDGAMLLLRAGQRAAESVDVGAVGQECRRRRKGQARGALDLAAHGLAAA